jgi:hypothetical protein
MRFKEFLVKKKLDDSKCKLTTRTVETSKIKNNDKDQNAANNDIENSENYQSSIVNYIEKDNFLLAKNEKRNSLFYYLQSRNNS